jgi:hypothetical protein
LARLVLADLRVHGAGPLSSSSTLRGPLGLEHDGDADRPPHKNLVAEHRAPPLRTHTSACEARRVRRLITLRTSIT